MIPIAIGVSLVLAAMCVAHVTFGYLFAARLSGLAKKQKPPTRFPNATVLLSLRGSDPFLSETIRALGRQEYPEFSVHIVVDHESDPAWDVARQAVADTASDRFRVEALRIRIPTCSLKCSSLIQGVQSVGAATEVIVLADADIVPHASWLRDLVAPLEDESVGITTGNQWFSPAGTNLGSWVRSVWNAGAIVPTTLLGHPWAGSCAMRLSDIHRSGLLQRWRSSIVDDGPIAAAFHTIGRKVQFVPSIFMINRERCGLGFCFSYIRRMLTWLRLYEATYPITVLHALFLELICIVAVVLSVVLAVQGQIGWSATTGGLLCAFWLSNIIGYATVAAAVRKHSHDGGREAPRPTAAQAARLVVAVPVTHFIYAVSAVRAWFGRRIKWRKVTYEVDRKGQVVKLEYQPYRDAKQAKNAGLSI